MNGMAMPGMGMQGMNMGMMPAGPGMGMNGMGMQGMGMNGMNNMGMMGGLGGNAWRQLGYDYQLPQLGYKPESGWGAWELATRQYTGERMERSFFDNIISTLTNFFANRHLSEEAARSAHRRVYALGDGEESGSKSLGGSAAYQAFLMWDRDHHSHYHSYPTQENRERLVGLAVAELFSLWDRVQPRSHRANVEDAAQYAAATAKYLFDRHYDQSSHAYGYGNQNRGGRWFDDDSDDGSERRARSRSFGPVGGGGYGGPYGQMNPMIAQNGMQMGSNGMPMNGMGAGPMGGMNPMMMNQMNQMVMNGMQGMNGMNGMGMGMNGMQGMNPMMMQNMQNMQGMGMNGMNGMNGMGGMNGMQGMQGMNPMLMQNMQGMNGMGGGVYDAQAGPGMHPYTYGANSGVAYGNQAVEPMPMHRWHNGQQQQQYGYGQPRY